MQYTANYNLKKPEGTDIVNIDDLNNNADILDQKLKEVENKADSAPPNSVNDLAIGTRTPNQTQVPTSPGSGTLSQILSWLANRIKAITGKTNWWDAPPTTLQAAKNHIDAAAPHSGHETPSGAQAKANAALNSAKQYTDQEVAEVSQALDVHKDAAAPHSGHETLAGAQAKAEAAAGVVQAELNMHKADIATEEKHGLRVNNDKELEFFDGTEWKLAGYKKPDPDTWAGMQMIVRAGIASNYYSVGDQIVSMYDGKEIIWEIIGIDVDIPTDSQFTHSITIQTKDCLHDIQFDAPEPSNPDSNREQYGNNRYVHSAIRQWLNSDEPVFNWQSQHQYDAPPDDSLDIYNGAGFLYRLDPELVAVIGVVDKRVARNTVVDGGGQDTFSDKVFLLSQVEVGLGADGDTDGEVVYPYYDGITNAGRIKLLNGSARLWWLRSPYVTHASTVRYVTTSGSVSNFSAMSTYGLAPACCII